MAYNFTLAPRDVATPALDRELLSQLEGWGFDPRNRKTEVRIKLCEAGFMELKRIDWAAFRLTLSDLHHLHPEAPLNFYRYDQDFTTQRPSLVQSGRGGLRCP